MSSDPQASAGLPRFALPVVLTGAAVRAGVVRLRDSVAYIGGLVRLIGLCGQRIAASISRRGQKIRLHAYVAQAVRVGVRAIPIICLVQFFIGVILALNLAPTLQSYGQIERTADVVMIAVFRELGALITAIVLSGFAGAAIAAELGAMVEGEEIKALRAHALDPIAFLVVPRVAATSGMTLALTVLANVVAGLGGFFTAVFVLGVPALTYIKFSQAAVGLDDYFTGLFKAAVFGMMIAALACYEGLHVRGGAEGVGRATTTTVVKSIVALIGADCVFAAVFYSLGW